MGADKNQSSLPRLILTAGEPAGIGPDIVIKVAQYELDAQIVVIGDPDLLEDRARQMAVPVELTEYDPAGDSGRQSSGQKPGQLCCLRQTLEAIVAPGKPDSRNAGCVLSAIEVAVESCKAGHFDAMVTAPVSKSVIAEAGWTFTGHTEYIAKLCDNSLPVMMLMNNFMRVALVTTHLPLGQVAGHITRQRLWDTITVVNNDLKLKFNIASPRILICGLNPHAGEQGHLGTEEIETVIPVIDELKSSGLNLTGPVPADTAFTRTSLDNMDAVIAMYHDQGLPVLKSHGFGETVNVTLGLPIIRTSVDHGTAFDLAGTGKAEEASMVAAINCALDMVNRAGK